jgi:FtsZ-interacting cell division protein ZipA
LQYARELDQFCIDVDVMISLQLLAGSGGPFAGTKLRGVVEAGGGELKDDGQFHFADENGQTLFILGSLDRKPLDAETLRTAMLRGVLLQMDLPRIVHGAEAFNQMILVGRKLETALSSKLMDENQRLLGDPEIDKIRQQLKVLYSRMFARGIVPGSPSALRLFS